MTSIVMRRYVEDAEVDGLIEVEASEGEVDLIPCPRTEDAVTYSLSVEETWRLIRELSRAACDAEGWLP